MKYWAFVSYSHRDAVAAAAIQRALETYRIPPRLVGRATPVGEIPRTLSPVFRDREDLQAGADLTAKVREALAESRHLLVVCSPEAARSAWVNREIVEFKKLHGEDRVLAVIVGGEPFACRLPGREGEECFPEALRHSLAADGQSLGEPREPIAADLRPGGDSKRLVTLKLVAGMLGGAVGVDELGRRDAQRRARRMASFAVAGFAGMAVMTVMALVAIQSREEAERQRAKAEDLLEFMLGDLRRKLEPVGRLDALDVVGEKALAYYAEQGRDALDADSLGRRARAQHLLGEIHEKRGKLDEALKAFEQAARTTGTALERSPGDGQRVFEHAQSVYWVGYVARRRGQLEAAEQSFLQYRDLAQRLVAIDAAKPDWRLETAYAAQNLGVVQLETGRLDAALASFVEARDAYGALVDGRPSLAFELADSHGWVAKAREAKGDYAGAVLSQRARIETLARLPDAAKDKRAHYQAANAHYEVARLRLWQGDLAGAEADAIEAVRRSEALSASDPGNLSWLSEATFHRLRLADVQLLLRRLDRVREHLVRIDRDLARLVASDATVLNWQVNLRGYRVSLSWRLALAERRPPPAAEVDAFLERARAVEAGGRKLTRVQSELVAQVEIFAGDAAATRGNGEASRERWAAASARLEPLAKSGHLPAATQLARAKLRLGDAAGARSLAALLESSSFRHPAYAGLLEELDLAARAGRTRSLTGEKNG